MDYVVSAKELYAKIKEILDDGMDYVAVSLLETDDTDPDDPIPAGIHFDAFRAETPFQWIDYEEVETSTSFSSM